jgi:hypothetical protein
VALGDKHAKIIVSAEDRASDVLKNITGSLGGFKSAATAAVGTLGFAKLASDFIEVNRQFQAMQASLVTVTGSTTAAATAFKALSQFAQSTPFQLSEVTQAFIKMQALGLNPTEATLESFGNTASAMGKSLDQMVEAVADATTGEFERLKEFGVKTRQEGENVSFTFQGVTTTVAKNAEAIKGYLEGLGNVQFAGAMEKQMNPLGGARSNLEDAYQTLLYNAGQASGANDQLGVSIGELSRLLSAPSTVDALTNMAAGAASIASAIVDMTVAMNESIGVSSRWLAAYTVGDISLFDYVFTGKEEARKKLQEIELSRDLATGQLALDTAVMPPSPYGLRDAAKSGGKTPAGPAKSKTPKVGLTDNENFIGFDTASFSLGGFETSPEQRYSLSGIMTPGELAQSLMDNHALRVKMMTWQNEELLALQTEYWSTWNTEAASFGEALFDYEIELEAKKQAAKTALQQQQLGAAMGILGALQSGAMKNSKSGFEIAKAAAIAETTINTYKAATGAYSALAPIPVIGPALGVAAAAAAIAAGMANVQAISKQQFGSSSGGGGITPPSFGAGGASSPSVTPVTQPQGIGQGGGQVTVNLYGAIGEKQWFEDNLPKMLQDLAARNVSVGYQPTRE